MATAASSFRVCLAQSMPSWGHPQLETVRQGHKGLTVFAQKGMILTDSTYSKAPNWVGTVSLQPPVSPASPQPSTGVDLEPQTLFWHLILKIQPATVSECKCKRKEKQGENVNEFKEKEFPACGEIKCVCVDFLGHIAWGSCSALLSYTMLQNRKRSLNCSIQEHGSTHVTFSYAEILFLRMGDICGAFISMWKLQKKNNHFVSLERTL